LTCTQYLGTILLILPFKPLQGEFKLSQHKKLLILVGSPRKTGNSATLANAVKQGAEGDGSQVTIRHIDDYIANFLRDCRTCRLPNGECAIADNFKTLFFDDFLSADGVVFCSPIYWYGLSAQTKAFFDRTFCYYAASYPKSTEVISQMMHKRIGLVLASEETYPGASLGIVHQIQEYARYTKSEFVGVVRGVGNSRSEVVRDPSSPLLAAEDLGREIFARKFSDFSVDTLRNAKVWPETN
jgi:multimeric flavodoxin WrbA